MAKVINLAKMPAGRDNKFVMTEDHKKFYIENNAKMTLGAICRHIGVSYTTMYQLIKEFNLPKKQRVFSVPGVIVTEYFSWENATLLDPIFGLSKGFN